MYCAWNDVKDAADALKTFCQGLFKAHFCPKLCIFAKSKHLSTFTPQYPQKYNADSWLPTSADELKHRDWPYVDVILVSGDAYVDHPSFGAALIGRLLESQGLKVAILPQPNWRDDLRDFKKLGRPRLFFGVTAGNMDSMVNHYTANKRLRSDDAYSPGGKHGFRPDYASVVYTRILKQLYPDVPVLLGGVEASLRRFAHYDYWADEVKPSVLVESGADLLVYGMGEKPVLELVKAIREGQKFSDMRHIPQTAFLQKEKPEIQEDDLFIPSYQESLKSKTKYAEAFKRIEQESVKWESNRIIQQQGNEYLVVNPSFPPTEGELLDYVHDLPFTRLPHPRYFRKPAIPAWEMIKFSVNTHRGCFGGCSFCTISAHQGKFVVSRSEASIMSEIEKLTELPGFAGHLSDLGGPSANMYRMQGFDLEQCRRCKRISCIYPGICKNLNMDHKPMTDLYQKVAALKAVKRVTIGSGLRFDMFIGRSAEDDRRFGLSAYFRQLMAHHVSGRLKVAPEHTHPEVLDIMRKPSFEGFQQLHHAFMTECRKLGKNFQLIPYFISAHPGSRQEHMKSLEQATRKLGIRPEQVQTFTPTPMTLATAMYHTGINPYTGKQVYVAKSIAQRQQQHECFFWHKR